MIKKLIKEGANWWDIFSKRIKSEVINNLLSLGYNKEVVLNAINNTNIGLNSNDDDYILTNGEDVLLSMNNKSNFNELISASINSITNLVMNYIKSSDLNEARNKHMIKIIDIPDHGRNHDMYCDKILWLRKARRAGDIEIVNNTVLGKLRDNNIKFQILDINENKDTETTVSKNVSLNVDFNAYYSEKRKKFDGGVYTILEYIKENKPKDVIVRLDVDKKTETSWDEVDLFFKELSIKKLDYTISDNYPKYTAHIECNHSSAKSLIKLLTQMAALGNGGHSYQLLINDKSFYFDGDGADHISKINGISITHKVFNDINKQIDMYNNGVKENNKTNLIESKLNKIVNDTICKVIKESSNSQIKRKIINRLYSKTKDITSYFYRDTAWQNVRKAINTIEYIIGDSGEVNTWVENGGYVKNKDGEMMYKEYKLSISMTNGIEINGSLKCHAAGTLEDPFEKYDMTITFW